MHGDMRGIFKELQANQCGQVKYRYRSNQKGPSKAAVGLWALSEDSEAQ